mgnify:CR=1 FL=1
MLGIGVSALDGYWTGVYQAETRTFRATSLPTEWDNALMQEHGDSLPDDITDYLVLSAEWASEGESWDPEVSKGSYGYGVKYTGYKSAIRLHNKETKPVIVNVAFDSQVSGAQGWTLPLTGLQKGDAISPTPWTGTARVTIPTNGYVLVKITSAIVNISGCMDSTADNYNPDATQSDGSCEYRGCTDPDALNYDSSANVDDGSCISRIGGCTCSSADNYDSSANVNDGSCVYPTSTDYKLPVEFVPPSLASIIHSNPPWMVKCDTGWFNGLSGKHTNKFNYNTSNTNDEEVSLSSVYSGGGIYLGIRPMPGYTINGTHNGQYWEATFDSPYQSPGIPDGTYGGNIAQVWKLNAIEGPTEADSSETAPENIIDFQPEVDEDASVPSTGTGGGSSTITTQSNQTTVVEPETSTIWWPFFGLAVFATGVAWFMKEPKSF